MKTLLLKDYLFLKRHYYLLSLFCYLLIPIVTSFNYDVNYWGIVFSCSFASIYIIETLNQDTRQNWKEFQAVLPIKKSNIVSEKYVLSFIISLLMIVSCCGSIGMKYLMSIYHNYEFTAGEVFAPFVTIAIIIIGNGIMMYLYYRSGMNSTKMLSAGSFILAAFGGAGIAVSNALISSFDGIFIKAVLALAVAFAVYAFSWVKAIKIYEKNGVKI